MNRMILAAPLLLLAAAPASAQSNAGDLPATTALPFQMTRVADFERPWKLAFLPDGRMLVTEKPGRLWLVDGAGARQAVTGVPAVEFKGQGGLLGVYAAPGFACDRGVYLTFSEPGGGGSGLALGLGRLAADGSRLEGFRVLWRQLPRGKGGQFGAYIAFAPDAKSLFLSSGERQRFTPAQDPDQATGKILHLTLDGKPWPGNPMAGKAGAATVRVIDPPKDTTLAATAPARTETLAGRNEVPAETWSTGHRNPYGLAFDGAGRLWETEMGPMGGDELNLIEKGRNYGWPLVSYGRNYDGVAIPAPDSRPDLERPKLYWNPVISPAGLTFYRGDKFPAWRGSALIGALSGQGIVRVAFDGTTPRQAERFDLGFRVRDIVTGPDGAVWLLADGERGGKGGLLRLTPR